MNFNEFLNEKVTIETERYYRSHLKNPKGFGKWLFSYNRDGSDIFEIPSAMSWADAQKWAKKKAKEDGESYVYVMESIDVNEKMKVFMNSIISKMIPAAFGASSNVKMREEIKVAVATAIEPILKKYDYIVEEEGRDTLAELDEMTMGQLERIEDYAEMISDRMEQGQKLESWMYSQITVALENLNTVHDGMDGSDGVKEANKPGPDAYMTGLDDETEEDKKLKK